jgi:hypothetical protein
VGGRLAAPDRREPILEATLSQNGEMINIR